MSGAPAVAPAAHEPLRPGERVGIRGADGRVVGRAFLKRRVSRHPGGWELWETHGGPSFFVHPRDRVPAIYR